MPSTHKFQPLHPRNSLRRIKTAFTPSSPTPTTSPSTTSSTTSRLSTLSFGNMSSLSVSSCRRAIRRKKSVIELEQEEERNLVAEDLVSLVEPRPSFGLAYGGIEEVLGGRA